ncbi:RES family NAD+ phosphorylase [Knoellia locipacati]|uniref:RES family NAD+ phosphorylase n=1 Tax=Knoellia locipacati TaxID=882824 RepID=UPI00384A676E
MKATPDPDTEARFVPDPPDPITPLVESWPAGTSLHTCYEVRPDGAGAGFWAPPPGAPPRTYRFSDFGAPYVPVLYAGESQETAVAETILRNAVTGGRITRAEYARRALARLTPTRDLRLASLRGPGLAALGVTARYLTDTEPFTQVYQRTVRWAEKIHTQHPDLDGLIWMSRPRNTEACLLLFGDRFDDGDLVIENASRVFALAADRDWLAEVCDQIRVTLTA